MSNNESLSALEKSVEYLTGRNVSDIRNDTFDGFREKQAKKGIFLKFFSVFPFIGRGNVNKDNIINHEDVNKQLDKVLH